ncbi:hypothetical protein DBR42_29410 [Pelomonas sp. HMWF004]|nr:hypothetical protein DBR42_29410 [Pelomonas sp. HMWF004]
MALADELLGAGWRRSRKGIRMVAVLCALLSAVVVFSLFNRFGGTASGDTKPPKQLVASIDLSIGNPIAAAARGEAKARTDLEASLLQLQAFGKEDAAKAQRLKQRYGVTWVAKDKEPTPVSQAFADGYNRVMQTEIERRHGKEVLDRLVRDSGVSRQDDRKERP